MQFSTPPGDETRSRSPDSSGSRFDYRWVIVACCTVLVTISTGISYSFGFFLLSLQDEFAWDRADASIVFSVYLAVAGVAGLFAVPVLNRVGVRPTLLLTGAIAGLSLFIASSMESPWLFTLVYGVMLPLSLGGIYLIAMTIGSQWFRGSSNVSYLAIGTGTGLGGIIIAPVCARLISAYDWRDAYLILGIIAAAVFILVGILLKDAPTRVRQADNRIPAQEHAGGDYAITTHGTEKSTGGSRNLWLIIILCISGSFAFHLAVIHIIPKISDLGYSLNEAARVIIVMGVGTILSRIFVGNVSEAVDRKIIGVASALTAAIALFWLVDVEDRWGLYLFAALYGMAWGGIGPSVITLFSELRIRYGDGFGQRPWIGGWLCGGALGAFFGGYAFELADHYKFAFFCGAWAMILAAICIWNLKVAGKEEQTDSTSTGTVNVNENSSSGGPDIKDALEK